MPTNIQNANISAAKLGISNVSKIFVGHTEIFPNAFEIQSAAFTDTSTLAAAGGNRILRITGDVGSTYNLTGYGAGSFTLPSSPYDQTIAISSNGSGPCYSGSNRTITTTLTPTGNTILQGGGSNFASSFTQDGGTGSLANNVGLSISVTNESYITTTVNGVLKWAAGASWLVIATYTVGAGGNSGISKFTINSSFTANMTSGANPSGVGWTNTDSGTSLSSGAYWNNPDNLGNSLGSGTYSMRFAVPSGQTLSSVSFGASLSNANCYVANPSSVSSSSQYP